MSEEKPHVKILHEGIARSEEIKKIYGAVPGYILIESDPENLVEERGNLVLPSGRESKPFYKGTIVSIHQIDVDQSGFQKGDRVFVNVRSGFNFEKCEIAINEKTNSKDFILFKLHRPSEILGYCKD